MEPDRIQSLVSESIDVKQALAEQCAEVISEICDLCVQSVKSGGTLFFCGNGGSFTDSLHIVGELVGRFAYDRPGLPGIALGANSASLTAIGNDYGYEEIFAREVDALVKEKDVVVGLSTSGGSKNVMNALSRAKEKGAQIIGWTGSRENTPMDEICDLVLHVPSSDTPRIQESHILVGHIVAMAVEEALHPKR